jgi:hypothetical protein
MTHELERIWEEAVVDRFRYFAGMYMETTIASVRTAGPSAEI